MRVPVPSSVSMALSTLTAKEENQVPALLALVEKESQKSHPMVWNEMSLALVVAHFVVCLPESLRRSKQNMPHEYRQLIHLYGVDGGKTALKLPYSRVNVSYELHCGYCMQKCNGRVKIVK